MKHEHKKEKVVVLLKAQSSALEILHTNEFLQGNKHN